MKTFLSILFANIVSLSVYAQLSCTGKTTVNFSYTGSAQTWTVPAAVTSITIKTTGASGGLASAVSNSAGGGATMEATYNVSSGQTVTILVAGHGTSGDIEAGGGGATGVYINGVLKLVAGGGGGEDNSGNGGAGITTNNGTDGSPAGGATNCGFAGLGTSGTTNTNDAKGGTGGAGGHEGENCTLNFNGGGGGGGFSSDGGGKITAISGSLIGTTSGKQGSVAGADGGQSGLLSTVNVNGGAAGGWGWSGGGGAVEGSSGGGGGYSGGGGAPEGGHSGGGGSYSDATNRTASFSANGTATTTLQDGEVIICFTAPVTTPLTLLSFSGVSQASYNQLKWKTANEFNVDKFIIERSENGTIFSNTGQVPAVNTFIGNDYSFNDNQVSTAPQSFYRLKILDHDGTFEYSSVIIINRGGRSSSLSVYPNPATEKLFVNSSSPIKKLEVINATGNIVYTAKNVGLTNPVPVKGLSKGIYMLKVYYQTEVVVQKFIKD